MAEPLDARSMTAMAIWAGISSRNLNRLFRHETGCSYGQWREQLRLAVALEQLARGAAVAAVADALGYACPSNFIVMFKRHFGLAPGATCTRWRRKWLQAWMTRHVMMRRVMWSF
jgi:AraC-like DNA-binding protein